MPKTDPQQILIAVSEGRGVFIGAEKHAAVISLASVQTGRYIRVADVRTGSYMDIQITPNGRKVQDVTPQ